MTTTPSPPSPSNLRPAVAPLRPPSVFQSGMRHQSPGRPHQLPTVPRPTQSTSSWLSPSQPGQPGPRELAARSGPLGPLGPQGHQVTDQAYPSPLLQAHQTPAPSNLPSGQPVLPLPTPASQPPAPSNLTSGCPGQPVLPQPGHRPGLSPAWPTPTNCHPHACSQILTFRPLPIKPHVIFIGKGRFCLYLHYL